MPRWYDVPPIWLGLQIVVMEATMALVGWIAPCMHGVPEAAVWGGVVVAFRALRRSAP